MKYFFDTEFIEDGKTIDLLSIGIVSEDGREFYAESLNADFSKANGWVKENVLAHLFSYYAFTTTDGKAAVLQHFPVANSGKGGLLYNWQIALELLLFIGDDKEPEFWADYGAYDWVALCQLFGTMMDLPETFPMFVRDVQQELRRIYPKGEFPYEWHLELAQEHNALGDARETKRRAEIMDRLDGLDK